MLKLADRVKETSITVGNGIQIALAGAFGAFQTFASTIGDGNSTYYTIENNNNFEVGVGTYNASNNTLSRDLVLSSTNNNQRISLDGVSIVFCCYPASQAVLLDNGLINSPSLNYSGIVFPSSTVIDTSLLSGIVSTSILPTSIVYSNDSRLSDSRNPNPHTHPISDITALQNALDSKQPTGSYASSVHSHVVSDVQNLQSLLDGKQAAGSYAASSHSHTSSQITDFAAAVSSVAPPTTNAELLTTGILSDDRLSNNIVRTSDSRLSDARTPVVHSHSISDVTNLQSSLDSKQASGNYASSSHQHIIADVSGLQSALDNKQPSGSYATSAHSHSISDISDLQSVLNNKQPSGNYADLSHTHISSNITDFNSSVSGLVSGIYAPLSNPTLTGVPLTPTASSGTNTNQIASTSFVRTEISNLVASAPSTLDTLNELATALGNDPNFATTITNNLANKAALSGATFTGSISSPSGSFTSLKVNNAGVSLEGHGHSISDISNLQTSLDGKANTSHSHVIADVDGLQASLDGKQASGSYATSSHTHTSSQIIDFNSSVSGLLTPYQLSITNPVTGTGTNSYLTKFSSTSGITSSTIIESNGNIGINTASPLSALHIYNSGNTRTLIEVNNITTLSPLNLYNSNTGLNAGAGMLFSAGSSPTQTSSYIGGLLSYRNGDSLNTSTFIRAASNGVISSTTSDAPLYVKGTGASNSFYTIINGSVGINTITPSSTLDVVGLINASSGNFSSLKVNNTNVSVNGHNHIISDITSLQSALDSKQASGSYAALSHNHLIADVTGLQTALDGKQASGSYAASSHTHTASQITDFNSSVSGLLPTIANSGDNRILTSTGSSLGINAESGLTFDGSTLNIDANLSFDSFTESVVAIGNSSTSKTLDLTLGTVQTCALTGNCTFTMPTATAGKSFTLFLNTGAGGFTSTFTGVKWSASTAPTITTTANKVDIISFISDGSFWYGSYSQNY